MDNCKTVVFSPHDDGSGAFYVLCRLARALVRVADKKGYRLHLFFLNSSMAKNGQMHLKALLGKRNKKHKAVLVPTDNLVWLPKDPKTVAVIGAQIPDVLRKWVRPLWHCWPCEPNWIRPNLSIMKGEDWSHPECADQIDSSDDKWEKVSTGWGKLKELTPQWWRGVALGISMGVPQLHRVARREGFPSVEVGDWFFSVGLRGCMQESFVPPDIIATTEHDLRMIEEDEFKAREVWLTLHQAPHQAYKAHVANSPVRFREMTGLLWTGDPPPPDITNWSLANKLRKEIDNDISGIRKQPAKGVQYRVGYIVTGTTGVWKGIVENLTNRKVNNSGEVAIIDLDRDNSTIKLLENGGQILKNTSLFLSKRKVPSEEMHLATCRASDFGITRTAGGVLGFAETRRPSVLVDEPGHWLGRIQRDQCREAGLCIVVPISGFLSNPAVTIQKQANKLGTNSDLDQTVQATEKLKVGAELDLAKYLFTTYIE